MSHLRKVAVLVVLSIGALACSLTAAPAAPTAEVQASPTSLPSDTPAPSAAAQASDTPAPADTAAASDTPNPLSQFMPAPFMNMMNASQYLNPVGQPVQAWDDIPVMPQAIAGQEFVPGAVYSFKAAGDISKALAFYQSKMPALGFSLNGGPGTGSAGTGSNALHNSFLDFYKGSQILLVYVVSYDADPGHVIVVLSTQ